MRPLEPIRARQRRAPLLWGVSLATLITALGASEAQAQSLGALMAATHQATSLANAAVARATSTATTSPAMALAAARALQYQTQVNSTLSLAMQAQAAAQAAAANQNLARGVVDGLTPNCQVTAPCGLTPAVTQITPASADATGLATWQGASLPTVSATNPNQVTITQTDPRAVLSWTTFNVGQNTQLTFAQQPGWVALNRVVGQIDPTTGLRLANLAPAPSQILGSIKSVGTVLVINQNGIIFGPNSQVNVGSLIATSLEIGSPLFNAAMPNSLPARNAQFLNFGLLGFQEQNAGSSQPNFTFSAQQSGPNVFDATQEGAVQVEAGASLTSADGGYLMLLAPQVVNAGLLSSADGEVALQSGRQITLTASEGDANSVDPDVRGLVVDAASVVGPADTVTNTGIIQAPRGYVSLGASSAGTVTDGGVITSTTSVSANGYVNIFGSTVDISPNAVISIGPDSSTTTIPQDPTSLANFQPSRIRIGEYTPGVAGGVASLPSTTAASIDIGGGSLIYAPGANISIGADQNASTVTANAGAIPQVVVESGAVIDVAGLTNVLVPASRNSIEISPVLGNELADAPAFRNGFLNGATVFIDPRITGVTADGVAWVGSPLISAGAFAQEVGITISELMVKGGNVTLGVPSAQAGSTLAQSPQVIVKSGATIDVSGGWKTFQAGNIEQSYLVDASGEVVPISQANPNTVYVAVYSGFTENQPRWGTSQSFLSPVLSGSFNAPQYTEGQDAGSLTLTGSALALDGQVFASAYAGPEQILGAKTGTATATLSGDQRALQAASSQLPAGGYLDINGGVAAGDVDIVGAASFVGGTGTAISLSADAVSAMGLSQLTVQTSGKITVAADAAITLAPGGVFDGSAGRTITIDGSVTAPAGSVNLTTSDIIVGSVLAAEPVGPYDPSQVGPFDIVINGELNVAGRWANDFKAAAGDLVGSAYLNGGEITLEGAPRVSSSSTLDTGAGARSINDFTSDVSGSLVINPGATLNLSGGGYVSPTGVVTTTAKGGDLSLIDDTTYFQVVSEGQAIPGGISGFRVSGITFLNTSPSLSINPAAITSRVSIADGSILDAGFAGGGTFTLTTPYFSLGASSVVPIGQAGSVLPMDFFSTSGFSGFNISSYGTALLPNNFNNGFGGFNAVLETQIVTVGAGQTLSLTQSAFSPVLSTAQLTALRSLGTGGSLYSVLTPGVASDAFDQLPVSLTLGGLLELHVDAGGQIIGSAGGSLTVSELNNEGLIRIPGGSITQSEILPGLYSNASAVAVANLSDVFGAPGPNGTVSQSALNALGITGPSPTGEGLVVLTNGQVAAGIVGGTPIYLLGDLKAGQGVFLGQGSVIDLSGAAIVNPHATPKGGPLRGQLHRRRGGGGRLDPLDRHFQHRRYVCSVQARPVRFRSTKRRRPLASAFPISSSPSLGRPLI